METSKTMRASKFLPVLLLVAVAAGCHATAADTTGHATPPGAADDPQAVVIATVDGAPLTLSDAMDTFLSSHTGHGALVQGEATIRELAGRTIERRLFLSEAETLGLRTDPEVVDAVAEFRQSVAQSRFWKREVDDKVDVSDEDVEAFYAKTDVALSVSLIEVADRDEAESLRARALAGEDFSDLAQEHSIHDSADLGGVLSFVRRGEMDEALEGPAFDLREIGSMTPVIETANGWAFVRLDARTVNSDRPPRDVIIPRIRSILKERAVDELREAATARVDAEAGVVVHAELLDREALLGSDQADAVVAESAGETLTMGAFREQLNLDAVRAASAAEASDAAVGLAREWAQRLALRRAMQTRGLLDDPEVVELARAYENDTMLSTLYERYVYASIEPTEERIRAYYDEHLADEFTRPTEVHMAYIVVEDEAAADDVMRRLDAGEDFADLAREASIDKTSAAHGGRIGWIRPGQLLPEVEQRAFALPKGTVDGPIRTDIGVFVIDVLGRTESEVVPYAVAKQAATRKLYKQLMREAYDDWARRLRERADIRMDEDGIRQAAAWFETHQPESGAGEDDGPTGPAPAGHGGGPGR